MESLLQQQRNLIVNIPVTQKLYDNLTLLEPAVWEILIPENALENVLKFKNSFQFIAIPPKLFQLCSKSKVNVSLDSDYSQIQISALSAELAIIYTLREITIPRIFVALGMLRKCDITQLKELTNKYYKSQEKIVNFLSEMGTLRPYRSDKIRNLLLKYNYRDLLGRFSLYVRDFIKNEFIYEKIM